MIRYCLRSPELRYCSCTSVTAKSVHEQQHVHAVGGSIPAVLGGSGTHYQAVGISNALDPGTSLRFFEFMLCTNKTARGANNTSVYGCINRTCTYL